MVAGHYGMAGAGIGQVMHAPPCHTSRAVQREVPVPNPPVVMIPPARAPDLPPLVLAVLPQPAAHPLHLQQIPAADPPPPRSI